MQDSLLVSQEPINCFWIGKGSLFSLHTISNVLAAGFHEVLVVLGNDEDEFKSALQGYGNEIKNHHNSDYKKGLTSSIQQGVDAADDQTHGFIICLGDMFGIKGFDYAKLARYHLLNTPKEELITLPKVGDQIGNPVIFSQSFRSRIMGHDDPEGCKLIVKAAMHSVQYFKSNTLQFLQDIDTWDDYHRLSER